MNLIINSNMMTVGDREFLLADVVSSQQQIGVCPVDPYMSGVEDRLPYTEIFYAENEPIIVMTQPTRHDNVSDKLITQISSIGECSESLQRRLEAAAENYFNVSQGISRALQPVLEVLSPGLYVCHVAKMIPTDGTHNYFMNAYSVRHEVRGTAEQNGVIGKENNYIPPFLIPTKSIAEFSEDIYRLNDEKLKSGRKLGGIALHLTGLFCALLTGHHNAMSCLMNDIDFNCIVIEPLRNVLYESDDVAREKGRQPKVIALSAPHVKIPIEDMPPAMLEHFLLTRRGARPSQYSFIARKLRRSLRSISKKKNSREVYDKVDLLPDCAMIESANAIFELTEEQTAALLAGETQCNGETIITSNYYNSVVIACNFLQYQGFSRFLDFAEKILATENLTAVHKYVAERLSGIPDNEDIYNFFREMLEKAKVTTNYSEAKQIAESYVSRHDQAIAMIERDRKRFATTNDKLMDPNFRRSNTAKALDDLINKPIFP
ncbi:hypothetical protein FACS189499_02700 [Clostridia bacterium]|nr:hypothetical protein FACS189499_02700 [Clostridia bacterium]